MNDNFWMAPFFGLFILIAFVMMFIGAKLEGDRIYDNCMENNKTMIHQDAVKLCKDIVK